ncbi:lysophospholipid acyltransferase family protein [Xanthomonadaceae bacterium JHOS43]|nr:lysophospholipid acyltransferase family protein [Xanthomonadaceae bacterium JHOS43]
MLTRMLVALTTLLFGAYPRWIGTRPSRQQRIYFANHGSHLDTVTLWASLPPALRRRTRPVAAKDYWGGGLRAMIARHGLNAVLIDRQRESPNDDPLAPLHAALAQGDSLILFPEGTRNPDDTPGRFKSGLYHLACAHPEVEPVAVYLDNARRSLPKGSLLPVPLICTARFGVVVKPQAGESKDDYLERARAAVMELA